MSPAKRFIDVLLAGIGLIILSPLLLIVARLVRREDGGPAFFRAERIGLGGRPFRLWKFRTMECGSELAGKPITIGLDSRVTTMGQKLRRYKLDELPQLFNVLNGTMSLVGPRPEAPEIVALYTDEQRRVLDYVPGITDPASIRYVNEAELLAQADDPDEFYRREVMPDKLRINLEYQHRATVFTDLKVMLETVLQVFKS